MRSRSIRRVRCKLAPTEPPCLCAVCSRFGFLPCVSHGPVRQWLPGCYSTFEPRMIQFGNTGINRSEEWLLIIVKILLLTISISVCQSQRAGECACEPRCQQRQSSQLRASDCVEKILFFFFLLRFLNQDLDPQMDFFSYLRWNPVCVSSPQGKTPVMWLM